MKRLLGAILAAALWSGCGGTGVGTSLIVNVDLVVATNTPDSFSIAGVSTSLSTTRTYTWSCSEGQANLSIGSELLNGWIRLEVWDGAGALVHDNTYDSVLIGGVSAFTRSGGASGLWTLKFTFHDAFFTGALTLTADTAGLADAISIGGTGSLNCSWIYEPHWTTDPVHVSAGGMSAGTVRVQIWDGAGTLVLDQLVSTISAYTTDVTGSAGVWTVQLDFSAAAVAGAVTLSQT
jgi:hypothetical protein